MDMSLVIVSIHPLLGMETRRPPMVSKARAPMDRLKEGIVMDSKDPTEARVAAVVEAMAARCREVVEAVEAAVLVMEDGMTVGRLTAVFYLWIS